nr:EOG090X0DL4 [Triops cancriformis]
MNQPPRRTRTPSIAGSASLYSYASTTKSRATSRSLKSLHVPWYKRPLVQTAFVTDIQTGSLLAGIFGVVVSLFTIATAIFDIYCLGITVPGVTHYGFYIMSFQFVYVGNMHVRNSLIVFALFSALGAFALLVTSIMLLRSLRKEYEGGMVPWLLVSFIFFGWRTIAIVHASIVNDMIFGYHILMCLLWVIFIVLGILGWIIVYSLYLELSDLTRLEDIAHLRMGTMSSLNITHSIAGSRPTSPHSTVSTAHAV